MGSVTTTDESRVVRLRNGADLPLVGFGTWQLRGKDAYRAVRQALEVGYRHLDTATFYGNEEEVGRAVRDSDVPREEVFLTTKLWPSDAGQEAAALASSLRALGTDYLDLWLIHWPPGDRAGLSTWQAFLAAQERGQVRAVGVSNYDPDQLDLLAAQTGQLPAVNQVPWSPGRHDPQLLAAHRERGVVLEGYSPLKGSRLRARPLTELADRHGVTPAQVVLRWHVQHRIPVIPKSANPERIAANADLFGFSLSRDEMSQLDTM